MDTISKDLFEDAKVERKSDFAITAGTGCSLSLTPNCGALIGACDIDSDCGN